jgi:hypothetical protein
VAQRAALGGVILKGYPVTNKSALFLLTLLANAAVGAESAKVDPSMHADCVKLAGLLNQSGKVNINQNEVTPLYTWRASCAEKQPTGTGNVMALCEGTSIRNDGKAERLFFWSKTKKGTVSRGYFSCRG